MISAWESLRGVTLDFPLTNEIIDLLSICDSDDKKLLDTISQNLGATPALMPPLTWPQVFSQVLLSCVRVSAPFLTESTCFASRCTATVQQLVAVDDDESLAAAPNPNSGDKPSEDVKPSITIRLSEITTPEDNIVVFPLTHVFCALLLGSFSDLFLDAIVYKSVHAGPRGNGVDGTGGSTDSVRTSKVNSILLRSFRGQPMTLSSLDTDGLIQRLEAAPRTAVQELGELYRRFLWTPTQLVESGVATELEHIFIHFLGYCDSRIQTKVSSLFLDFLSRLPPVRVSSQDDQPAPATLVTDEKTVHIRIPIAAVESDLAEHALAVVRGPGSPSSFLQSDVRSLVSLELDSNSYLLPVSLFEPGVYRWMVLVPSESGWDPVFHGRIVCLPKLRSAVIVSSPSQAPNLPPTDSLRELASILMTENSFAPDRRTFAPTRVIKHSLQHGMRCVLDVGDRLMRSKGFVPPTSLRECVFQVALDIGEQTAFIPLVKDQRFFLNLRSSSTWNAISDDICQLARCKWPAGISIPSLAELCVLFHSATDDILSNYVSLSENSEDTNTWVSSGDGIHPFLCYLEQRLRGSVSQLHLFIRTTLENAPAVLKAGFTPILSEPACMVERFILGRASSSDLQTWISDLRATFQLSYVTGGFCLSPMTHDFMSFVEPLSVQDRAELVGRFAEIAASIPVFFPIIPAELLSECVSRLRYSPLVSSPVLHSALSHTHGSFIKMCHRFSSHPRVVGILRPTSTVHWYGSSTFLAYVQRTNPSQFSDFILLTHNADIHSVVVFPQFPYGAMSLSDSDVCVVLNETTNELSLWYADEFLSSYFFLEIGAGCSTVCRIRKFNGKLLTPAGRRKLQEHTALRALSLIDNDYSLANTHYGLAISKSTDLLSTLTDIEYSIKNIVSDPLSLLNKLLVTFASQKLIPGSHLLSALQLAVPGSLLEQVFSLQSSQPSDVVLVSAEVGTWSRVGGLAVMVNSLARALGRQNVSVTVISPFYDRNPAGVTDYLSCDGIKYRGTLRTYVGSNEIILGVHEGMIDNVLFVFLHHATIFPAPYQFNGTGMLTAAMTLCRGALDYCLMQKNTPALFVSNDWLAAPLAMCRNRFFMDSIPSKVVHMIHNLGVGYDGSFYLQEEEWGHVALLSGSDPHELLMHNTRGTMRFSLTKLALLYADQWGTVSPSYRQELLSHSEYAPLLSKYPNPLAFCNGTDVQKHKLLAKSLGTHEEAKKVLQQQYFYMNDPKVPIFTFVGRLSAQKGVDLLIEAVARVLGCLGDQSVQFLFGGKTDGSPESAHMAHRLGELQHYFPRSVWADPQSFFADGPLAFRGSDFVMVPSRFEPCGLVQLEAMAMGTPVIAFATGGLRDTVVYPAGFVFFDFTIDCLERLIYHAISVFETEEYLRMREAAPDAVIDIDDCARNWKTEYAKMCSLIDISNSFSTPILSPVSTPRG